jgi:hypothetical protein
MDCIQRPVDVRQLRHFYERKKIQIMDLTTDNHIIIIASIKLQNNVGAAIGLFEQNRFIYSKKLKLAKNCSAFQAELFAILNSINYILRIKRYKHITIISRTKALFNALQDLSSTHQLVYEIYEKYYQSIDSNINIKFTKNNNNLNDIFNRMIRIARESAESHNRIEFDLVPMSFVKNSINNINLQIWDQRWSESTKGRTTKQFIISVFDRKKMKKFFPPDFYVTQSITGHNTKI